jgi:hypothetical protein
VKSRDDVERRVGGGGQKTNGGRRPGQNLRSSDRGYGCNGQRSLSADLRQGLVVSIGSN